MKVSGPARGAGRGRATRSRRGVRRRAARGGDGAWAILDDLSPPPACRLAACVEWTELCPRTAAKKKRLICLTPTVHSGAFVGGVDD